MAGIFNKIFGKSVTASNELPLELDMRNIPRHIAIVMDGNGRWAKSHGMPRAVGHRQGVVALEKVIKACDQLNVKYLTVYAFSTENWKRPEGEVNTLMKLMVESATSKLEALCENQVKVQVLGDMTKLPEEALRALNKSIDNTKNNTGLVLNLAINYGSRWDILQAVKTIAEQAKANNLSDEKIANFSESDFAEYLTTKGCPDPDLLIRTSGEIRLSNFLLWELAYTEFYFTDVMWPNFDENELHQAIAYYQHRNRRFGKV